MAFVGWKTMAGPGGCAGRWPTRRVLDMASAVCLVVVMASFADARRKAETTALALENARATFPLTLARIILDVQDTDGSWLDYPLYDYHQQYGTAFALLTLHRCRAAEPAVPAAALPAATRAAVTQPETLPETQPATSLPRPAPEGRP